MQSRDRGLLPIYQWLRILFDDTLIEIHDIGAYVVLKEANV